MSQATEQAARTIANQASKLGYDVDVDVAATGSIYLMLNHPTWHEDHTRLVRVADHAPNEARYIYRVNQEPDLCVDAGFQVPAVKILAEWAEIDPASVPYLRRAATIEAKKEAARVARDRKRLAEIDRHVAASRSAYDAASDEDRRKVDYYGTLHGRTRKNYRKRNRAALSRAGR